MNVTIPMSGNITPEKEQEFEQAKSKVAKPQKVERQITKIKVKRSDSGEDILINYNVFDERAKDGFFTSSFPCKEEARNQFYTALDETLEMFMEALGLDSSDWEEGQIIGMSIKHTDDGYGVTITGKCEIEGRYACPTTPYMILDDEGGNEYRLIEKVLSEAIAYLDGARRQTSLFGQDPYNYDRGVMGSGS